MKPNNFFKLAIAVGVCELAGVVGSLFTAPAINGPSTSSGQSWYAGLIKPALNPPSWVFGPAWITLYFLMGVAAFLIWRKGFERKDVKVALGVFGIQLFLNAAWSIIFFGLKNPGWAFVDITALWLAIILTIIVFSKISRPAAWLLIPYIFWVSFAGYLNYSIWTLNQVEPIACTMEAKLCSDGSYVGRTGPNCEFAACPKEDLIQVEIPRANETISSPLIIKGQARGSWFFEADFPVVLTNWDGLIIAEGYAAAKTEWMTEEFVPFEAELEFEKPAAIKGVVNRGALILQKDNPSGLPEYDDALEIPIMF